MAEVKLMLNGSWKIYYKDKLIAGVSATEISDPIRARNKRKELTAAHDPSWVYLASAPPKTYGSSPTYIAKELFVNSR